jgi:hypothetical protein
MSRWSLLLFACVCLACEKRSQPEGLVEYAAYGVFFGGQIQERQEIPFTLDRTKQRQGFRVDFRGPLATAQAIKWEIDRPGPRGQGRKVVMGEALAKAGVTTFERELPFAPGDPLGTWNVRVTVGDEAAVDRPVLVYDDHARKTSRAAAEREKREQERSETDDQDAVDETK